MKPPPRLIDDERVSAGLRAELQSERTAHAAYDVERGLTKLQAALTAPVAAEHAPPAADSTAPAAPAPWIASTGAKLLVATAVVGAVSGAVVLWPRAPAPQAPSAPPAHLAQPPAEREIVRPESTPLDGPSDQQVRAPAPAQPPAVPADLRVRREIEQLGAIKYLLEHEPARAYRLAQAGHREFGRGLLYQEREGLAVLALVRLGQREHARRRARVFFERYPDSPLRAQIERRLRGDAAP